MDEVTNNQQYIAGYFFGRYLACGYVSGSLVCLPVPVQDTTCRQRLEAFIKPSMRKVTTFCGVCIDSMELANHLRSDWGCPLRTNVFLLVIPIQNFFVLYLLGSYLIRLNHFSISYLHVSLWK